MKKVKIIISIIIGVYFIFYSNGASVFSENKIIVFENFNNPDEFLEVFRGYGSGIKDTTAGKFSEGNSYEGEYSLKIVYALKKGAWGVAVKRIFDKNKDFSTIKTIELYTKNNYNYSGSKHFFEIQLRSESGSKWVSQKFYLPPGKWVKISVNINPEEWKLNGRSIDKELFYNDLKMIKSIRFYLRNENRESTGKEEWFIDYITFEKGENIIKNKGFDLSYLNKINDRIKKIIKNKKLGVYVYTTTLAKYYNRYNIVADEMSRLRIDEVYLSIKIKDFNKNDIYKKEVRDFIYNLKKKNKSIKIYAIVGYGYKAYTDKEYLKKSMKDILNYNESVSKKEKFDGFSFDIEPHIMKKGRGIDESYPYRWGKYGKGEANDMLLKDTLKLLKIAKSIASRENMPISEAIAHFFHDHYLAGDLSVGGINDFLNIVNYVIMMDYSDKIDKILRFSEKEINDAKKDNSIMIALKTKSNKMGSEDTTFWQEGIKALDNAVKRIYNKYKNKKSFRGIAIFEYDSYITLYKR